MASISKRRAAAGETRYDVRYRAGDRAVEETFKRRQDAENRVRQVGSEKLTGPVADPRRGRERLVDAQPGEAAVLFTGPRGEPITRALLSPEWRAARRAADAPEGLRIHDREIAAYLDGAIPEP